MSTRPLVPPPATTVVNIRREPCDVYVGRAGRGESGYFGNPYRVGPDGSRDEVLAKFRNYFRARLQADPAFRAAVEGLRGKRLGCFCKPATCHGDVIVGYLETGAV